MKIKTGLVIVFVGAVLWMATSLLVKAQAQAAAASAQRYECAMIKWDGPDKIQFILPDRTEMVRVFKDTAVTLPRDIHDEEYCVIWACNKMGKEGWEPIQLHATRVMFKRPIK